MVICFVGEFLVGGAGEESKDIRYCNLSSILGVWVVKIAIIMLLINCQAR